MEVSTSKRWSQSVATVKTLFQSRAIESRPRLKTCAKHVSFVNVFLLLFSVSMPRYLLHVFNNLYPVETEYTKGEDNNNSNNKRLLKINVVILKDGSKLYTDSPAIT
jgi:hypothetical protein